MKLSLNRSKLSLNKSIVLFFTAGILVFLGFILPAYLYSETKELSIIRNATYLMCCFGSFWVLLDSILSKKRQLTFFYYLFLFFTLWTLIHLVIASVYDIEGAVSDIVNSSYSMFALALGTNLNEISKYKFFRFLIYLFWCLICYFVITSLDPLSLQAIYGKEDPLFSGAYQGIGDSFAIISILLIFQQLQSIVSLPQKSDRTLDKKRKMITTNIDRPRNDLSSICTISWMMMTLVASNIVLFLNSSRASFYSFMLLTLYIIYVFYISFISNKYIKRNIPKLLLLMLVTGLIAYLYLLSHGELMSSLTWDSLLSNRNFELFTEKNSSSLDDRHELSALGFQDIINNPVFGSYISRVKQRGPGTYIHNIMDIMQDFGIPAFASFVGLISYCIGHLLKSFRHQQQDYETMVFNTLLIYSIVQLLYFRNALGFYAIYINFGIMMRRHLW
jgi:hypothetical protein